MFARLLALLCALTAQPVLAEAFGPYRTSAGSVIVERVAGPLRQPWAFSFLPDGDGILVTEKGGALRVARGATLSPALGGVPRVQASGQGGLLDVAVAPDFATTRQVYLTYSEPAGGGRAHTTLARAQLAPDERRLRNVEILFRQRPSLRGGRHFGSRIVFADDGTLFVTLGDRGERDLAQDLDNHIGKIVRLNRDGSVPADNPYVGHATALPEIYSYGHRNPQGAASDAGGVLHTISHGARGGDEVNRPEAGRNFGWPAVSYGTHYSGRGFPASSKAGTVQPLHYWDPSIAPSGATFYTGSLFPQWQGDLFVGALKYAVISRLDFEGSTVTGEERLFDGDFGRIRDVRTGPDGALWFANDARNGGIYRVVPGP